MLDLHPRTPQTQQSAQSKAGGSEKQHVSRLPYSCTPQTLPSVTQLTHNAADFREAGARPRITNSSLTQEVVCTPSPNMQGATFACAAPQLL